MVKAIKVMLIPNNVQKTKMFQYAGASRFAYNWALAREKENYEKGGKFISDSELRKEFTKLRHSDEYAWLLNISNNVTKQAIKDVCTAYKNFFKGLQKFPWLGRHGGIPGRRNRRLRWTVQQDRKSVV